MEGQSVVTDPRKILINVTKTKLNHNDTRMWNLKSLMSLGLVGFVLM